MRRRLGSILLSLVLLLTLAPALGGEAAAANDTTLYIAGRQEVGETDGYDAFWFNSGYTALSASQPKVGSQSGTNGASATFTYSDAGSSLLLNGYKTKGNPEGGGAGYQAGESLFGIYYDGDLTIQLVGYSELTGEDWTGTFSGVFGIFVTGNLTITGTGTLTVDYDGGGLKTRRNSAAICCGGTLTITDSATVHASSVTEHALLSALATIVLPQAGEHPVSAGIPGDAARYTVLGVNYYTSGGTRLTESDTFAAGRSYSIYVNLKPVGDYSVQSSVVLGFTAVTVNGLSASYWSKIDNGTSATYNFKLEYSIPEVSATITLPRAGEHPVSAGISAEPSKYTVIGVNYYRSGGSIMQATDTFRAGSTYNIYVNVKPAGDYAAQSAAYTNSTTARINGLPAKYWTKIDNGSSATYNFTISYTIPEGPPYSVVFDADGGSGFQALNPVMMEPGGTLTLPPCAFEPPTARQEFDAWDAGSPGEQITVSEDMTIRAIWKDAQPAIQAVTVSGTELSWSALLPKTGRSTAVVAAWYGADGRLLGAETGTTTANGPASGSLTVAAGAARYKLIILDSTALVPLCEAWDSAEGS
jgi:hypothetical protein